MEKSLEEIVNETGATLVELEDEEVIVGSKRWAEIKGFIIQE